MCFFYAGWIGPTLMTGIFIIGSLLNKVLMTPVVRLTFRKEEDFRFKHVFVRTHAESLAFCGTRAEHLEHRCTQWIMV